MREKEQNTRPGVLRPWLVAAVLIVQCLAFSMLIVQYERIVRFGTEIRLPCQAYDPSDVLRGRYLHLSVKETTDTFPSSVTNALYYPSRKFYVRLDPSTNGLWTVTEAAFEPGRKGLWVKPVFATVAHRISWSDKRDDEETNAFIKRREDSGLVLSATFPNRLFVNEKRAPEAEKRLLNQKNGASAVYRVLHGKMVLTGIEIDGKSILEDIQTKE